MKRFVRIILSTVICLVALITTGCTAMYYCVGCVDKISRDSCACMWENTGCINYTCRTLSCLGKDCYNEMCVEGPNNCANEIRNNYNQDSLWCSWCADYSEIGSDTFIASENYTYSYTYKWEQDSVADTYYKAKIEVTINPNAKIDSFIMYFTLEDAYGNSSGTQLYFGNVKAGRSYSKTATFVFKGSPNRANPKVTNVKVKGHFKD